MTIFAIDPHTAERASLEALADKYRLPAEELYLRYRQGLRGVALVSLDNEERRRELHQLIENMGQTRVTKDRRGGSTASRRRQQIERLKTGPQRWLTQRLVA